MRTVHGSTVLYPCDANQTAALVEQMADLPGIYYTRTTREKTPILYGSGELFPVGAARLVKRGDQDRAAVIASGITVHEAVKAYDKLRAGGIEIRIIDAYAVKPIDKTTLGETVKAVSGKLVTVEDHWLEGGLGDAVLEALELGLGGVIEPQRRGSPRRARKPREERLGKGYDVLTDGRLELDDDVRPRIGLEQRRSKGRLLSPTYRARDRSTEGPSQDRFACATAPGRSSCRARWSGRLWPR